MKFFQCVGIGGDLLGNFGKIRMAVIDVGDVIASFSTPVAFVQQSQTEKSRSKWENAVERLVLPNFFCDRGRKIQWHFFLFVCVFDLIESA